MPEGFAYADEFISTAEEQQLLAVIGSLPFKNFAFQQYTAKRRVVEYGYAYDFSSRVAEAAPAIPEFLHSLQTRVAAAAGIPAAELVEAIVTEYPPGAPIGWHRDVKEFETVFGISLLSACRLRLKPYPGKGKIVSLILEPRSLYVFSGASRWEYQHSIPAVRSLRYSITFRTLRTTPFRRQRVS
jgi:alkylated DNA repair dioxygenase AlkB